MEKIFTMVEVPEEKKVTLKRIIWLVKLTFGGIPLRIST